MAGAGTVNVVLGNDLQVEPNEAKSSLIRK
jgi:hypothetical protein